MSVDHLYVLFGEISIPVLCPFFKKYLFFREKRRAGEREGEKYQCVVASHASPTGDLACNPGMCPDWESNQRPLVHRLALNPLSYTNQVCPFLNWIVCCFLLVLSCMYSLYILDINPLSDIPFANIFSHSVCCLFVLLMVLV